MRAVTNDDPMDQVPWHKRPSKGCHPASTWAVLGSVAGRPVILVVPKVYTLTSHTVGSLIFGGGVTKLEGCKSSFSPTKNGVGGKGFCSPERGGRGVTLHCKVVLTQDP